MNLKEIYKTFIEKWSFVKKVKLKDWKIYKNFIKYQFCIKFSKKLYSENLIKSKKNLGKSLKKWTIFWKTVENRSSSNKLVSFWERKKRAWQLEVGKVEYSCGENGCFFINPIFLLVCLLEKKIRKEGKFGVVFSKHLKGREEWWVEIMLQIQLAFANCNHSCGLQGRFTIIVIICIFY